MDDILALIAIVEAQERDLVLAHFTLDDAWELGSSLVRIGREREHPITIDITRGAQQVFHAALDGTSANNDTWIGRKSRTVRQLGTSSYLAGLRAKANGSTFEDVPWVDPLRYSGHGGGFPVSVRGVGVVGTLTVSGLPQADDHALAVEALEALRKRG